MARRSILDVINVVDVESTCWDGDPPPGQMSEIIEIGIVQVDLKTLSVRGKVSIMVRPERSTVSQFCTELTTITQDLVDHGCSLQDACHTLLHDFKSKDSPWASYGDYDRKQFNRVCTALGVPYPFGDRHVNVKTLLAATYGWDREVGMSEALSKLGVELKGTHHRAADDAANIATMFAGMMDSARKAFVPPISAACGAIGMAKGLNDMRPRP